MSAVPVNIYPAASTTIQVARKAQVAIYAGALGGIITNPFTASDQGVPLETLFYDFVNPAGVLESGTTFPLTPGASISLPPNMTTNVTVNAATRGHKFSALVIQPQTVFPPIPTPSTFPPSGPTGLLKVINAYLFQEYNDDQDLQAYFASFNSYAQNFVDWFNQINLPIYTSPLISGTLLDWVALGLYGVLRPTLSSGKNQNLGPYNTAVYNQLMWNGYKVIGATNVTVTSDDIFKRILTWRLYRGDGQTFNPQWLKRRIIRFLNGPNGTDPVIQNTYAVSVSFPSRFVINVVLPIDPNAIILQEAMQSGAVELPFQYQFNITIA